MNPPSEDLKDELISSAVGVGEFAATSGWSVHISKMPDSPDTCIALYDTGGFAPSPKWLEDYPTVQIRVRGTAGGYKAAWQKAIDARDALLGLPTTTLNNTIYQGVWVDSDVAFISYDDKNRPLFTCNLRISREPASGTYRT
jgi:hypothetical protein